MRSIDPFRIDGPRTYKNEDTGRGTGSEDLSHPRTCQHVVTGTALHFGCGLLRTENSRIASVRRRRTAGTGRYCKHCA